MKKNRLILLFAGMIVFSVNFLRAQTLEYPQFIIPVYRQVTDQRFSDHNNAADKSHCENSHGLRRQICYQLEKRPAVLTSYYKPEKKYPELSFFETLNTRLVEELSK